MKAQHKSLRARFQRKLVPLLLAAAVMAPGTARADNEALVGIGGAFVGLGIAGFGCLIGGYADYAANGYRDRHGVDGPLSGFGALSGLLGITLGAPLLAAGLNGNAAIDPQPGAPQVHVALSPSGATLTLNF